MSTRPVRRGLYSWAMLVAASVGLASLPASASPVQLDEAAQGVLRGVAAVSTDDAWAVGYSNDRNPSALIQHWDGQSWSVVDANAPGSTSQLYAVSAASSTDVWAAGVYVDRRGYHGFVEHWDGSRWSTSPLHAGRAMLAAISAGGPDDVWAASRQDVVDGVGGRVFHWDGSAWSEVATPQIGWFVAFTGVLNLSPTDAWLVGYKKAGHHTIVEHWDGTKWRIVASDDPYRLESLYAVAAADPQHLWAVGLRGDQDLPPQTASVGIASQKGQHELIMHSTGHTWKHVQGPNLSALSALLGVAAEGQDRAWAVGFTGPINDPRAIIVNWDGTQWTSAGRPGLPRNKKSTLYAVDASSPNDAWAVGTINSPDGRLTVFEHWDGSTWSRV